MAKNPIHVMIDLETLGIGNNAAIIQLGAVCFDLKNPPRKDIAFTANIDIQSNLNFGRTVDGSTLEWWLSSERNAARKKVFDDGPASLDLPTVLDAFQTWWSYDVANIVGKRPICVWGNAATFDLVILRNAFEAINRECLWSYRDERCFRTLKSVINVKKPTSKGTHHNALDDATFQTSWFRKIAKKHAGIS